ncbi:MAG: GntR family transcriptional regulator, partial [Alphaproteobacteria bacterium]
MENGNPAGARMNVDRVYHLVKDMAVHFRLRPGERVNEGALAKKLGTSRTPLREALNRLTAERLLDFQPNKGFFCRGLDPREVFDFYEYRRIIEEAAIRLACERATDAQLTAIARDRDLFRWSIEGYTTEQYVGLDEKFHLLIAQASGNQELVAQLA